MHRGRTQLPPHELALAPLKRTNLNFGVRHAPATTMTHRPIHLRSAICIPYTHRSLGILISYSQFCIISSLSLAIRRIFHRITWFTSFSLRNRPDSPWKWWAWSCWWSPWSWWCCRCYCTLSPWQPVPGYDPANQAPWIDSWTSVWQPPASTSTPIPTKLRLNCTTDAIPWARIPTQRWGNGWYLVSTLDDIT